MKTYLLLRSNKQTGPYSFDELLTLGLRAQDLLWVEGKSASWRYPSELDEFRAHVPVPVIDPMPDSNTHPAPAVTGPVHPATVAMAEPTPEKENFHFHPRIRAAADPQALQETMHFHPRLNAGPVSFQQGAGDPDAFPTLSRFMQTSVGHSEPRTPEINGATGRLPGMDAAVFHPAKPPADADDEVPSLALQAFSEPAAQPAKSPAAVSMAPRITVTLPAAVADKTMVIIHPREQHPEKEVSAPTEQLQQMNRRPVLEFLEDPAHGATPDPVVEPAGASLPMEADEITEPVVDHQPVEETQATVEPVFAYQTAEAMQVTVEPALESQPAEAMQATVESALESQPVEVAPEIPEPVVEYAAPASTRLSPEADFQPASADADSGYALPPVRSKDTTGILQKIAVAAAIISLVSVAALIANSVFNPNAYNYETKSSPAAPVRKLPATQNSNGAAMAPGSEAVPGSTVTGDSDQSIKSETAGNALDNQAKPAVKKIE